MESLQDEYVMIDVCISSHFDEAISRAYIQEKIDNGNHDVVIEYYFELFLYYKNLTKRNKYGRTQSI